MNMHNLTVIKIKKRKEKKFHFIFEYFFNSKNINQFFKLSFIF